MHGDPYILAALYHTLQLLIFQSSGAFPSHILGQALFFLLPLLGLLVVVQSTLNFGRHVLDKAAARRRGRSRWQPLQQSRYRLRAGASACASSRG